MALLKIQSLALKPHSRPGPGDSMADGYRPLVLSSIHPKGPGLFSTVSVTCREPQGAGGGGSARREIGHPYDPIP